MANWPTNKCGFCGHTGSNLPKYVCPECQRTGCSTCMPDGESVPCKGCVDMRVQQEILGIPRAFEQQ